MYLLFSSLWWPTLTFYYIYSCSLSVLVTLAFRIWSFGYSVFVETLFFESMMALKRHFHEKDGDGLAVPVQGSKRRLPFPKDVTRELSLNEIVTRMEPFLRRVVREEVDRVISPLLHPTPRSVLGPIETSEGRGLQLCFVNKLPPTIFTGSRIEAEDNFPIGIVLFDTRSNSVITSGPLSSGKIEIIVLDGDFGSVDKEDWTENEFKASVLREREGKRPLVTGELVITLRDGIGYIGDIIFTDNSSWIRSRKFRLGARVMQRIPGEVRIREARSEAFMVKDHRGELYKKHHPPSLGDEVWRLERIAKDGALENRMASFGIKTVKDFLQLYAANPSHLRKILGGGSDLSNKIWETIIEHANACVVNDGKLYIYYQAAQGIRLLLNSIYKVIGAAFNGQHYLFLDELTLHQKFLVEKLKLDAYKNVKDFIPINEEAVGLSRPLTSLQAEPSSGTNIDLQQLDFPITHHEAGQGETQLGFNQPSTSTSYTYEADDNNQFEISNVQNCHSFQMLPTSLRNSFSMGDLFTGGFDGGIGWFASGSQRPIVPSSHLVSDDISQVQTSTYFPLSPTMGQENNFFFGQSNEGVGILSPLPSFGVHISRNPKPKAGWCKLRAAVKWGIICWCKKRKY